MKTDATKEKGAPNGHSAHLSHVSRVATAPLSGAQAFANDNASQAKSLVNEDATDAGFPAMVTASGDVVVMTADAFMRLAAMLRSARPQEGTA